MESCRVSITPVFGGVIVETDPGPSAGDPLGQRRVREQYPSLDEALKALPKLVDDAIRADIVVRDRL